MNRGRFYNNNKPRPFVPARGNGSSLLIGCGAVTVWPEPPPDWPRRCLRVPFSATFRGRGQAVSLRQLMVRAAENRALSAGLPSKQRRGVCARAEWEVSCSQPCVPSRPMLCLAPPSSVRIRLVQIPSWEKSATLTSGERSPIIWSPSFHKALDKVVDEFWDFSTER
ncbi:uncharacterized protein LOC144508914 [Mustelus asterias]